MLELVFNKKKQKFHSFTDVFKWIISNRDNLPPKELNTQIDKCVKILSSLNYEPDFINYYTNSLNSLKVK